MTFRNKDNDYMHHVPYYHPLPNEIPVGPPGFPPPPPPHQKKPPFKPKTLGELIDKKVSKPNKSIQDEINKEIEKDKKQYNPYEEMDHISVDTTFPITKHEEYTLNYIAIDVNKTDYDGKYHEMFDNNVSSIILEFRAAVINALEVGVNKLVKNIYDTAYNLEGTTNKKIVYSRDASRLRDAYFSFYNIMNEMIIYIHRWNLSYVYEKQLKDTDGIMRKTLDIFARYCNAPKFAIITLDDNLKARYDKDTPEIVDGWSLFDDDDVNP